MNMLYKYQLIILLTLCVSGCGTFLNTFYDEHQTFIDSWNSKVGKNMDKVLRSSARPHEKGYLKVTQINANTFQYHFNTPWCSWAVLVATGTKRIQSWSFLGDTTDCRYKKFYEGAW